MKEVKDTDRKWAAGYMDASAYFGIMTREGLPAGTVVSVSRLKKQTCDEFMRIFGVGVVRQARNDEAFGWKWQVQRLVDVNDLLYCIAPFMRVRQEQAKMLLKYTELPRVSGSDAEKARALLLREQTMQSLRRLTKG
jgi:hypothetical protein